MSTISAVIETGGKQYKVKEGDLIQVERLGKASDEEVTFDKVLLISGEGQFKVGDPIIKGAKVLGKFVQEMKGKKIFAFMYKRRKNYRRKVGHRQKYSLIKIESVQVG
jgi:large subunit ribosomal protein L21